MKFGINLYLWADEMHDGLMPVLERLKQIGFDGVEVPIFDLDQAKWAVWGQRLDADEGPEGAQGKRDRDEIGWRHVNAMELGGKVVPQFVRAQDQESEDAFEKLRRDGYM